MEYSRAILSLKRMVGSRENSSLKYTADGTVVFPWEEQGRHESSVVFRRTRYVILKLPDRWSLRPVGYSRV
jgi:hypothetical protein